MTGGKLELSKCFYYILQWIFDDEGKLTHTTKDELEAMGVMIQVQEAGKAAPRMIKHLDCATAHRTLGLHKTPMGNQDEQLKKLQENSARIAGAIATSSITRAQATTAWNALYIPSVAYPLLATYFQEEDLTSLENKVLMAFLPKMGFNRHTTHLWA